MIHTPNGDFREGGIENLRLKLKVLGLCLELLPGLKDKEHPDPVLKNIGQGAYNRVIGITIIPKSRCEKGNNLLDRLGKVFGIPPKPLQLILRIPLDENETLTGPPVNDVLSNIVNILVISSRVNCKVPIPKVFAYDTMAENALERPYVMQNRAEGQSLILMWDRMSLDQRISAIKQITKITETIATVTTNAAGIITHDNLKFSSSKRIDLEQFPVPTPYVTKWQEDQNKQGGKQTQPSFEGASAGPAPHQSPFQCMMDQCHRWQEYERGYTNCYHPDVWGAIRAMVGWLNHRGWLGDHFHLVHGDLFPRNIIVKLKNKTEVVVTGIVDWDMAFFAPKFMALRPPNWAWTYQCDDGSDDGDAEGEVVAYETDFKEAFRGAASEEYRMMAFSAEGIIARKLFDVLRTGICRRHRREVALELVQEWNRLYPLDFLSRYECVQDRE
jgi:hypothetical protein